MKAVVFEVEELEPRDMSKLKALLPLLLYQDTDSTIIHKFLNFENR